MIYDQNLRITGGGSGLVTCRSIINVMDMHVLNARMQEYRMMWICETLH